jgi:hypothetical protein
MLIKRVKGPKRPIFEIFDLLKNKIFLYRLIENLISNQSVYFYFYKNIQKNS